MNIQTLEDRKLLSCSANSGIINGCVWDSVSSDDSCVAADFTTPSDLAAFAGAITDDANSLGCLGAYTDALAEAISAGAVPTSWGTDLSSALSGQQSAVTTGLTDSFCTLQIYLDFLALFPSIASPYTYPLSASTCDSYDQTAESCWSSMSNAGQTAINTYISAQQAGVCASYNAFVGIQNALESSFSLPQPTLP